MSRLQFESLLNAAWRKAAPVGNRTCGFSATGIYAYNPQAILQHVYAISDGSCNDTAVASTSRACDMSTLAVSSTSRANGSRLSSSIAYPSTKHGISYLKATGPIPQVKKCKLCRLKKREIRSLNWIREKSNYEGKVPWKIRNDG